MENYPEVPEIIALVSYLKKETDKKMTEDKLPRKKGNAVRFFQRYQWEFSYVGRSLNPVYNVSVIDITTLIGPAYVVRDFHRRSNPHCGNIHATDGFTYIPRKFTDRSDWEDDSIAKELEAHGLLFTSLEDNLRYILHQQTSHRAASHMTANVKNNLYDVDVSNEDVNDFVYSDDDDENEYDSAEEEEEGGGGAGFVYYDDDE